MADELVHTKLFPPTRRPGLLSRPRLLRLLYDLLDYKLILVVAPAGYGKTSLLTEMVHQEQLSLCWYTLHEPDREAEQFFAYFIAAITRRFPGFGERSRALLESKQGELGPERLAGTLVNEIHEQIREHFVIVLDDYHLVDSNQSITHFINEFVTLVGENCHLILVTRTLPSLPDLPRMVARSQVGGLGSSELAFQASEIQSLMLQNYQRTLSDSDALELARQTEGWITGLLLSAKQGHAGMGDWLRHVRTSQVGLYEYLEQQVLQPEPLPVQAFLLQTSLLEDFNAAMCERLLGAAPHPDYSWQALIDMVQSHNLFVQTIEQGERWIRYHPLFREFLQHHLTKHAPALERQLVERLAAIYAQTQEWGKARTLYERVQDNESIAELLQEAGPWFLANGRLGTLSEWLDALPDKAIHSRPRLLSVQGSLHVMRGRAEQGLPLLNQAVAAFREREEQATLAQVLNWRAITHRFMGQFEAALADIEEALALAAQHEEIPRLSRAEALRVKGLCLYSLGQLAEATTSLDEALLLYETLDEPVRTTTLLNELGMSCVDAGRYQEAEHYYERGLARVQPHNLYQRASFLNNMGVLFHLQGRYEEAVATLEQAVRCAKEGLYAYYQALALTSLGDVYAELEIWEAAAHCYQQARELLQEGTGQFLRFYLNLAEGAMARARGQFQEAHSLLAVAARALEQNDSIIFKGLYHLALGQLALAEGQPEAALLSLQDAPPLFERGGQRPEEARSHLYLALARHQLGQPAQALAHLEKALHLTEQLESRHSLISTLRAAKAMLNAALAVPALAEAVRPLLQMLDRWETQQDGQRRRLRQQSHIVPLPAPKLKIQTLGHSLLLRDGQPISDSDWQSQKRVRDLFFCLLAHPEGLTKEALGERLWPDSDNFHIPFKNAIYRLRLVLGKEMVPLEDTLYHFNWDSDYEYDVERFWEAIDLARQSSEPEMQASAYTAAAELYQGPYLPDTEELWVLGVRERLWQGFLEASLFLAAHFLHSAPREALYHCHRLLAADTCQEEAYRLTMRAYAALGNRAAIARQYQRCEEMLKAEFGVSPSEQTQALYRQLTQR